MPATLLGDHERTAAIVFGLAPALRAVAGNLVDALRDRGSDSGSVRGNMLRSALIVLEVALSIVSWG